MESLSGIDIIVKFVFMYFILFLLLFYFTNKSFYPQYLLLACGGLGTSFYPSRSPVHNIFSIREYCSVDD